MTYEPGVLVRRQQREYPPELRQEIALAALEVGNNREVARWARPCTAVILQYCKTRYWPNIRYWDRNITSSIFTISMAKTSGIYYSFQDYFLFINQINFLFWNCRLLGSFYKLYFYHHFHNVGIHYQLNIITQKFNFGVFGKYLFLKLKTYVSMNYG